MITTPSRTSIVHVIFAVGLIICLAAITVTLCYRVWEDGNNTITAQVTQNLTWLGMVGIVGLLGMFITVKIPWPPLPLVGAIPAPVLVPTPEPTPVAITSTSVHVQSQTDTTTH